MDRGRLRKRRFHAADRPAQEEPASLGHRGARGSRRRGYRHQLEPSGDGDTVVRNRVVLGLNHKLTPLTTARLNVDYTDNVDIIGSEGDETSDEGTSRYTSVRPAIAWQLTEDWSLETSYRFRYRLFDDDGGDAMSNSVFLTLQYNFPTWAGTGF